MCCYVVRLLRGAALSAALGTIVVGNTAADDAPPASQPAAVAPKAEDPAARQRRLQRDATRQRHVALPEMPAVDELDDLVTVAEGDDGLLVVGITPMPGNAPQPQARVAVRDAGDASFELRATFVARNGRPAAPTSALTRYDFAAAETSDDAIWYARVNASGAYVNINGNTAAGRITLTQSAGKLTVTYRRNSNNAQTFRGEADSVRELRERYPQEFDDLVVPLLSKFSDLPFLRPGPGDVYAAFGDLPADETVTARVLALLPQLASDAFEDRDAASAALAALGPPGVLAVLRLDPARTGPLTDEQRHRLAALVDDTRRLPPSRFDPTAARGDPRFLADCLEDPDRAVRAAAKRDLERVLGRPVDFDVDLPPRPRSAAADDIRQSLPKPQPPAATQPAS